jgi:omega-amidase
MFDRFLSIGTPSAAFKPASYRFRNMSTSSSVTGPTPGELAAVGNRPIFKVACVQMSVGADKQANLTNAATAVAKAAANGAKIVVLPEMFNCPYSNASFPVYAEEVPAIQTTAAAHDAAVFPSAAALSNIALQNKVYLVGGSIPEKEDGKLYNTCLIYSPEGVLLNKHRKVHLFDIGSSSFPMHMYLD